MSKKPCTAVVLSAGQGRRMGTSVQKQYIQLDGKEIICHTLETFQQSSVIDDIVLVVGKNQEEYCQKELVEKYHAQLEYYAHALSQLTGKTVKEKIIYSFTLKEEIIV